MIDWPMRSSQDFHMMRTVVGQDRAEAMRLPGIPMGATGAIAAVGDLEEHYRWLRAKGYVDGEMEDGPDPPVHGPDCPGCEMKQCRGCLASKWMHDGWPMCSRCQREEDNRA
jgi:hypothetical protein